MNMKKKVNDLKIKVLSYRKQKTESSKKFNEERAKITGKMMLKINPILAEYSSKKFYINYFEEKEYYYRKK